MLLTEKQINKELKLLIRENCYYRETTSNHYEVIPVTNETKEYILNNNNKKYYFNNKEITKKEYINLKLSDKKEFKKLTIEGVE